MLVALFTLLTTLWHMAPHYQTLLGFHQPITYLFLLENDKELRTHGGFPGSYAVITFSPCSSRYSQSGLWGYFSSSLRRIKSMVPDVSSGFLSEYADGRESQDSRTIGCKKDVPINLSVRFQDIYVPNGQITGHIDPPLPIQQAFKQGTFLMANGDWDIDFATAATAMRWFFQKGGEISPDIFGAITFNTINQIISILGPISLSDNQVLDSQNLYHFLQTNSEQNSFPGSTQKKDALTMVGKPLLTKFLSSPLLTKIKLAQFIVQELNQQNILLHSTNQKLQAFFHRQNWTGEMSPPSTSDYFAVIESNLGANKANNFVTRNTTHQIRQQDNYIEHQATITLTNTSPSSNPSPPDFYGGDYINYVRILIPPQVTDIDINQTNSPSHEFPQVTQQITHGFLELGFFHTTPAQTTSTIHLNYRLPATRNYSLTLLKQHGLPFSPQVVDLFGQTHLTNLNSNTVFR